MEYQLNSISTENWGQEPVGEVQSNHSATPVHWGELVPGDHVWLTTVSMCGCF